MAEQKKKKRRKPERMRKEADIRIRVSEEHKKLLVEAAFRDGASGVSSWLLRLGLLEAERRGVRVQ